MEDRDLYEEAKQKGKLLLIGFVSALILIGLILMIVKIVENANQPKPPVLELKLYDENWVELEKDINKYPYLGYKDVYEFDYDGKPKGFNAILYLNGSVLIRYDFTGEKNYNSSGLDFSYYRRDGNTTDSEYKSILPPIIERDKYRIEISIDAFYSYSQRFKSEDGRESMTRGELNDIGFSTKADILFLYITIK